MKLTIDRAKWLRGEGYNHSYLLRSDDQKMCCLGFYGLAMGATATDLRDQTAPQVLADCKPFERLLHNGMPTRPCEALMLDNDEPGLPEAERERRIAELFADVGVEVEFVGESTLSDEQQSRSE